ncbi:MAG: GspH/FimT family pseudopilin [Methylotenera sp.]
MLKFLPSPRARGFTLVELMVGIAIIAILATLATPSYNAWVQNTRIRTTAESIQNGLQVARAEAVKRNTQVQFVLGNNSEWTLGCVNVTADCPDPIQSHATGEGSSADITVAENPAGKTIIFNSLGAIEVAPAHFSQVDVDVSTSVLPAADSRQLRVTLGVGGNVRICDPALSSTGTDPRRCP